VGPVGGKRRPSVGKVEEWYVESRHLQGYSPCLCRLRTDGLALVSKYWTYWSCAGVIGSVSLVAGCQQKLVFSPLPQWLLWERRWVRTWDRTTVELWIVSGALLSGGSGFVQICWWLRERLLCINHIRCVWSGTIRGLSVGCVWCVGRVFPCRVYINSNRRDSQIWVSLVCGSHHVDNLTDLMSLFVIDVCWIIHLNVCNSCLSRVGCTLLRNDLNRAKTWKIRTHS
jgi:hypothetical protein